MFIIIMDSQHVQGFQAHQVNPFIPPCGSFCVFKELQISLTPAKHHLLLCFYYG
jgi:hypothetical protein